MSAPQLAYGTPGAAGAPAGYAPYGPYAPYGAPGTIAAMSMPVARPAGLVAAVASHARFALAAIVVLAVTVVGLFVYYRGVFSFGPFARGGREGCRCRPARKPAAAAADAETDRLIETINRQ
jgi:hypothetical protein